MDMITRNVLGSVRIFDFNQSSLEEDLRKNISEVPILNLIHSSDINHLWLFGTASVV
jgi:hypothetical protein